MEQNPYEAPRSAPVSCNKTPLKDRPWGPALITIGVIVVIMAAIAVLDLLGFWLSTRRLGT